MASLAVADLFVACLVMPLGAVYEVSALQTNHLFILCCLLDFNLFYGNVNLADFSVMETSFLFHFNHIHRQLNIYSTTFFLLLFERE